MRARSSLSAASVTPPARRLTDSDQVKGAVFAPCHKGLAVGTLGQGRPLDPDVQLELLPLVQALLEGNPGEVHGRKGERASQPPRWEVHDLSLRGLHERYPRVAAEVTETKRDGSSRYTVYLRTNGQAAFLDRSWRALQNRSLRQLKFRCSSRGDGFVGTADQAKVLFASLGEVVTLSRVMDPAEMDVWQSGEFNKLRTSFVRSGSHFALNNYPFKGRTPYRFDLGRDVLDRLYDNGNLVVNTYESDGWAVNGMGPEARAPFGLEFEIVVLGDGRHGIQPYVAEAQPPTGASFFDSAPAQAGVAR